MIIPRYLTVSSVLDFIEDLPDADSDVGNVELSLESV